MNFIGVMQDYYEQHVFGTSAGVVLHLSLVGAITNCVMNLMSIFAQILLSRLGTKWVAVIAGLLCTLGLELASLSTEVTIDTHLDTHI
jgi:hypothetical protein